MSNHDPLTPGEIVLDAFLKSISIPQYRLAQNAGVPPDNSAVWALTNLKNRNE